MQRHPCCVNQMQPSSDPYLASTQVTLNGPNSPGVASGTGAQQAGTEGAAPQPILEVRGLRVCFKTEQGLAQAVNDVSLDLHRGELLAIQGESGSGKSVTTRAIMGLLRGPRVTVSAERLTLAGQDMLRLSEDERRAMRGDRISLVFQDALSALNPVLSIGDQIGELFRVHRGLTAKAARERTIELLRTVQIPAAERRVDDYPHQFSGGMRQRILIAMAIALEPDVLIADEPTTALDVTVQAQILDLLDGLRQEFGMAILLITHDLGVVAKVADRVAVMYAGRIVETAAVEPIFGRPAHPYTEALLGSIPSIARRGTDMQPIPGAPPSLLALPSGCSFHPRCRHRRSICSIEAPPLRSPAPGRASACHFAEDLLA